MRAQITAHTTASFENIFDVKAVIFEPYKMGSAFLVELR